MKTELCKQLKRADKERKPFPNPLHNLRCTSNVRRVFVQDLINELERLPRHAMVVVASKSNCFDTPYVKPAFVGLNKKPDGCYPGEFISAHPRAIAPAVNDPFGVVVIEPFEVRK